MKKNELYDVMMNIDEQLLDRADALRQKWKSEQMRNSEEKTVNASSLMRLAASILAIVVATAVVISVPKIIDRKKNPQSNPDNITPVQNPTVQVSNVSSIISTTLDDSAPLYFTFMTVPAAIGIDTDFNVDCALGVDNSEWIFTWGDANPGKHLDDYYDFYIYARTAKNSGTSFFDMESSNDISFYGETGDYVRKLEFDRIEKELSFDSDICYSRAISAEDLPYHASIPSRASNIASGTKGSIFIGLSIAPKQGESSSGNGAVLYYHCVDNYIGFGVSEAEAYNNALLLSGKAEEDGRNDVDNDPTASPGAQEENQTAVIKHLNIDLNSDGEPEKIEVLQSFQEGYYPYYSLSASNSSGEELSFSLSRFHSEWKSYSLCIVEDTFYILEYTPDTFQGISNYSFTLYGYSDQNGFYLAESRSVSFDKNGKEYLPVNEMVAFAEALNSYLENSELLISTLDGALITEGKLAEERYSWIDEYVSNSALSLEEQLNSCAKSIYNNYHK